MFCNCLPLGLFAFLVDFFTVTVAREAIIGGYMAGFFEFPYQVSIEIAGYGHGCGGAILDKDSILTAASCIIAPDRRLGGKPITILAGTVDLRNETASSVKVDVASIFATTDYTPGFARSIADIAILKVGTIACGLSRVFFGGISKLEITTLNHSLDMITNKRLKRVSLPLNRYEDYAGNTAKIAGFGWQWINKRTHRGGLNDTHLRFIQAKILSHQECRQEHPGIQITEKHLCAKAKQHVNDHPVARGVCVGDAGSALVVDGIAIGIFNFGPMGCDETTTSAVYTRVSHYLRLIRNAKENINTRNIRKIDLIDN